MKKILGQPYALDVLRRALQAGRLHHAWVFAGPPGVGKFTTAMELATILLDPQAAADPVTAFDNPPDSAVRRQVESGAHPDLHTIRKELAAYSDNAELRRKKQINIPIDVLREHMIGGYSGEKYYEPKAFHSPATAPCKIFIVDEAELIDRTGQNALLKTLEEPPAQTYLFLITSRPQRLLPTIRSRCQSVQFTTLDDESIDQWFAQHDLGVEADAQQWIEWFCDGSPGRAQLAAEYDFYGWHQELSPMMRDLFNGCFPPEMGITLAEKVDEFAKAWVGNHNNASKDAANKAGVGHMLSLLGAQARHYLSEHCDDETQAERWLAVIDCIHNAERQIHSNVAMKTVFENLVAQWMRRLEQPAGAV